MHLLINLTCLVFEATTSQDKQKQVALLLSVSWKMLSMLLRWDFIVISEARKWNKRYENVSRQRNFWNWDVTKYVVPDIFMMDFWAQNSIDRVTKALVWKIKRMTRPEKTKSQHFASEYLLLFQSLSYIGCKSEHAKILLSFWIHHMLSHMTKQIPKLGNISLFVLKVFWKSCAIEYFCMEVWSSP